MRCDTTTMHHFPHPWSTGMQTSHNTLSEEVTSLQKQVEMLQERQQKSNRQVGDDAEDWVSLQLQGFFPDATVLSTARRGHSGDLRVEIPMEGSTMGLLIEVKCHANTVSRACVEDFHEAVHRQQDRISGAVLVSVSSNIAQESDFGHTLNDDGNVDILFLTNVHQDAQKLRLAVEFLKSRHLHRLRDDGIHQVLGQGDGIVKAHRYLRQLAQQETALSKKVQAIETEVAKICTLRRQISTSLGLILD